LNFAPSKMLIFNLGWGSSSPSTVSAAQNCADTAGIPVSCNSIIFSIFKMGFDYHV